jgi:hypothetical protein
MINERKQAKIFLQRQSDLCAALGQWWPTVVAGEYGIQQALQSLAHILVRAGGYAAAWVGVGPAHGQQTAAEHAMFAAAVASMPNEPPDSSGPGWLTAEAGPALAALAPDAGQEVFLVDIQNDPVAEPWRQRALRAGCRSMLVLSVPAAEQPDDPLPVDGAIVAAAEYMGENDTLLLRSLVPHLASIIRLVHSAPGT